MSTFANRRSRCKELGKKVPQAYRVYVEDTFLPCDAADARIFAKEEVVNMLLAEYDYETDIAVQRAEEREIAFAEGIEQGIEQGISQGAYQTKLETAKAFKQFGFDIDKIAEGTGLSIEEIKAL